MDRPYGCDGLRTALANGMRTWLWQRCVARVLGHCPGVALGYILDVGRLRRGERRQRKPWAAQNMPAPWRRLASPPLGKGTTIGGALKRHRFGDKARDHELISTDRPLH